MLLLLWEIVHNIIDSILFNNCIYTFYYLYTILEFAETGMYTRGGVAVRVWRAPCVRDDALPTQLYKGRGPALRGYHPLLEQLCSNWVRNNSSNHT